MGERVAGGRVRGWFTVPMRAQKRKDALHEPPLSGPSATLSPPCGERAGRGVPIRFMVPMHTRKRKGAFHEPRGTSNIEHPTQNIEWQRESLLISAFGVRCWAFDVFPHRTFWSAGGFPR